MRLGVSLIECVYGKGVPEAVAKWSAETCAVPALLPIWNRWPDPFPRLPHIHGVEPMIYVETDGDYDAILDGDRDAGIEMWAAHAAAYGRRLIVRWDQETNGSMPWSGNELYPDAFRAVFERITAIAPNVKPYYCPVRRGKARQDEILRNYPGDIAAFVGFDAYERGRSGKSIAEDWGLTMDTLAPLGPIIVGEFGILTRTKRRAHWLKGLRQVHGVWGANYFDMVPLNETRADGTPVDWTMNRRMRRIYGRLAKRGLAKP